MFSRIHWSVFKNKTPFKHHGKLTTDSRKTLRVLFIMKKCNQTEKCETLAIGIEVQKSKSGFFRSIIEHKLCSKTKAWCKRVWWMSAWHVVKRVKIQQSKEIERTKRCYGLRMAKKMTHINKFWVQWNTSKLKSIVVKQLKSYRKIA